ncbi:MAG: hypothetical protein GYA21_07305 [Myxococcales bacterium]|nr:hypothetical protein [Myxococcales bacterium]
MAQTFQPESDPRPIRSRVGTLAWVLLLLSGIAWSTGELNDLVLWLAAGLLTVAVVGVFVWQAGARYLQRPLLELEREEAQSPPSVQRVQRVVAILARLPRQVFWLTAGMWLLGACVVLVTLSFSGRLTGWQALTVIVLTVLGGGVDVILQGLSAIDDLDAQRNAWRARYPDAFGTDSSRGRLARWLLLVQATVVVATLCLVSLVWVSWMRTRGVAVQVERHEAAFHAMLASLDRVRKPGEFSTGEVSHALEKADSSGRFSARLVVLAPDGRELFCAKNLDGAPAWWARIHELEAASWKDLRAPFVFLSGTLSGGEHVIWQGPPAGLVLDEEGWPLGALAGLGLTLVLVLVLSASLVRLVLRPLARQGEHFSRVLAKLAPFAEVRFDGDDPLGELTRLFHRLVDTIPRLSGADTMVDLERIREAFRAQLGRIGSSADQRAQLVEQTATSVQQMRSSLEHISEQFNALRETAADCTSSMFEIDRSVREVAGSADNLQHLVEDGGAAMTQIQQSSRQMGKNVEVLARSADGAMASFAVMDAAIRQVEESTNETRRLSGHMSEIASRGAESVRQTISGIGDIQQVTDEARQVIHRLGSQIEAVGKILTVIGDVAEQTNLLALNAAIIAAGAGEHGKGFAVVADEIKNLADRTASSTKEIAGLIKSVQAESRRAVEAMERGTGSVKRGVALANAAGEALQEILDAVRASSEMTGAIAKGTAEHAAISRNVTQALTSLVAQMREMRRAMEEEGRQTARLARISEQLQEGARFVFRSANEQVQAVGSVSSNMERISESITFIGKALGEQAQGVGHVARVAEEIRDRLQQDRADLSDLGETFSRLDGGFGALAERLGQLGRLAEQERHEPD